MLRTLALPLAVLAPLLAGCRAAGSEPGWRAEAEREARAVLERQVDAWNAGDLEAFVAAGYAPGPDTTFYSGDRVTRGSEELLARYRGSYGGPGASMGRLSFEEIEVLPLSPDAAVARGRWRLDHRAQADAGGLFTLLLRRLPEGWRIVHDHTSSGS